MQRSRRRRKKPRGRKPDILSVMRGQRVSMSDLSRRTGIDRTQLRAVVSGAVVPSWWTLTRIADALGVTVGAFDRTARKVVTHE